MRRCACWVGVLLTTGLLAGCVERKYVITSDPPGAIVYRNGEYLGATPVDDHFVYYGKYHFTLIKDGYETLQVDQPIPTPWYEFIGIDFLSENVWPFTVKDVRRFDYQLQPLQLPRTDEVMQRAEDLRQRGLQIGPLPGTNPPKPRWQQEREQKLQQQQQPLPAQPQPVPQPPPPPP
jgi:PEGA domain